MRVEVIGGPGWCWQRSMFEEKVSQRRGRYDEAPMRGEPWLPYYHMFCLMRTESGTLDGLYVCMYIHKPPLWMVVSAATRFRFTAINRQTASLALATAHNCLTAPSIASGLLRTRRTVPSGLDFSGCNLWTMYALAWARMRPASRLSCRPRWLVPAMWTSCLRLQGGGRQKK